MDEMKFDKSGACVVISVMSALKQLGIKKNIVAIAPLVENMPSGNAYRPGDIIRASNSKTIEVLNTDAEGRLILADALAYTCRKYSPQTLIDLATLTGACSVALGDLASAILCDDEKLCSDLISCSHNSNERLWQLPSWSEYDDKIKSDVADIKNTGEKGMAGTIAGYSFLKNFVDCPSWAHIDIAGTANIKTPKWGLCAGGTGFGVRLCLEYITQKL
jgi:leucyl aminopeptidase